MPRKAKQPAQVPGAPAGAYPNRTDLAAQPVRAPSGQGYGERQATEVAQAAQPLPQQGTPTPDINALLSAARSMPFPDQTLSAPSERANEPVTSGVPVGAGPNVAPRPVGAPTVADMFARLSANTGDPEMAALAELARAQGA